MGKRNRSKIQFPSLFFVTSTLKDWKPLFSEDCKLNDFQNLLFEVTSKKLVALMGYVLMPSHIHLMVGCSKGGLQLSEYMRSLKSLSARRVFPDTGSIWMDGFDDLVITTDKQFRIKLNYIHENPVRKSLVKDVLNWKWSSAGFWMNDETHEVLTKDWDWMDGKTA